MKLTLAVLLIVTGLAGCGLFATRDEPAPGQAEVVIYRPGRLIAVTHRYMLKVDGAAVAELANGSFVRLHLSPGAHDFGVADQSGTGWSGTLQADRRHYLRLEVSGRAPRFELALKQAAPELAESELEDLQEIRLAE